MQQNSPNAMPPEKIAPLYQFLNNSSAAFKQFCVFSTAVELNMFDLIDEWKTPESLSKAIGADRWIIEDICEILTDLGFLEKMRDGYGNSSVSRTFLREASPWFQGEVIKNLLFGFQLWERLAHIGRHGPVGMGDGEFFAKNNFMDALQAEIMTGELQQTVSIVSGQPEFQSAEKLLDLSGGHGLYAIAFGMLNPRLSAVIYDLPALERSAAAMIERFGARNVSFVPGSMSDDDYGMDYDVVFFSYSPGGRNPLILEKIHSSLKVGGLFVTKHAFYRNGEVTKSRLLDLEWKLTAMKGIQKDKRVYSFAGDLSFEEYLARMEEKFSILKIVDSADFGRPPLSKFGDTLDSVIIVARKKETSE